jgi:hypothetical protein
MLHITRRHLAPVALTAAAALCGAALAPPGAAAQATGHGAASASATDTTVLREWNLRAQGIAIGLRPSAHGQSRGMAMVQGAVYDAVTAIDRGHTAYLVDVHALGVEPWASTDAAIAAASHGVLRAITPSGLWADLDAALTATLAEIPDGPAENEGVRAGRAAASAMLASRVGDGFMAPWTFVIGTGAGDWRPATPTALDPDPWVARLRPFVMRASDQFRTQGPNDLTSAEYTKEFNEVKSLGALNSTTRTADQTTAAIFWQFAPAALWNGLGRDLIVDRGLGTADAARLLAMIDLATADAAIACWSDKYRWNAWRPIAAIREADTDGNPDTVADPGWRSLFDPATPTSPPLATPAFPEHPSGHGCVTGAAVNTVMTFFGTDKIAVDMRSGRFPGEPRHFERLSLITKEVIDARVWGGIHFRSADVQGTVIGRKVVHWMDRNYFQTVS